MAKWRLWQCWKVLHWKQHSRYTIAWLLCHYSSHAAVHVHPFVGVVSPLHLALKKSHENFFWNVWLCFHAKVACHNLPGGWSTFSCLLHSCYVGCCEHVLWLASAASVGCGLHDKPKLIYFAACRGCVVCCVGLWACLKRRAYPLVTQIWYITCVVFCGRGPHDNPT